MAKEQSTPIARWTPVLERLPALSIRQPWAWLIVNGFKDVENRSRRTHHRGPLLIHAGLNLSDFTDEEAERIEAKYRVHVPERLDLGGIVGVVDVVDCVERHKSPWYVDGNFAWVVANPRRLKYRPCKGALGTFRPEFNEI